MMKRLFISIPLILNGIILFGQQTAPKLILPPPDAYSFTKYGDIPIGKFTGTMQYSVPLFQLSGGKLSIPLSLDYATNGVKVDEVAGRTGMGWTLRAGGVITRNIVGKADEVIPFQTNAPADSLSYEFYQYLKNVSDVSGNTQPDEFSYSFQGYSGKFYIDTGGVVRQLSQSPLKISYTFQFGEFTITTPDGIKYFFGNTARDFSDSYSFWNPADPLYTTGQGGYSAWHLTRIKHPYGDSVMFHYGSIGTEVNPIEYFSGVSQTYTGYGWNGPSGFIESVFLQSSNCSPQPNVATGTVQFLPCTNNLGVTTDFNMSRIAVSRLDEIVSKNGKVKFFYSDRLDIPGEQKLDSVVLFDLQNRKIRKVSLVYEYAQSSSLWNIPASYTTSLGQSLQESHDYLSRRLFMSDIRFEDVTGKLPPQVYNFSYKGINELPARLSFSQDKFGYFNGRINAGFVNDNSYLSTLMGGIAGTAREVDSAYSDRGVLSVIHYPTGGHTQITYESNKVLAYGKEVTDTVAVTIQNVQSSGTTVYSTEFDGMVPKYLQVVAEWLSVPDPEAPPSDPHVFVSIEEVATGNCFEVCQVAVAPGAAYIAPYALLRNMQHNARYRIRLFSSHPLLKATARFVHYPFSNEAYEKPSGGVRVAQVEHFSAPGQRALYRRYDYRNPDTHNSAGSLINDFQDGRDFAYLKRSVCSEPSGGLLGANYVLSSSSAIGGFSNDYLSVNYEYVTEYHDSLGTGGAVRSQFYVSPNRLPETIACNFTESAAAYTPFLIAGAPYSNTGILNGRERATTVYRYEAGRLLKQKETLQFHSVDTRNFNLQRFFVVRKMITRDSYLPGMSYFGDYDVNRYYRLSAWSHLDSTLEREYDLTGIPMEVTTRYYYDNAEHLQQTRSEKPGSSGKLERSVTVFPQDVAPDPVTSSLIAHNMIATPIESRMEIDGNQVSSLKTVFRDWFSDGMVLAPEYLKSQKQASGELVTQLKYDAYDNQGNPTSFTESNGIRKSYLWDSTGSFPIAEAWNAAPSDIAFTSFEFGGNWLYQPSGITNQNGAVTGTVAYRLQEGALSRGGLSEQKAYRVTYWLKTGSGSAAVNGVSGTLLTERNGWQLYESIVSSAGSVTVSGSGIVDEVRLCPENAKLSTYVIEPLVGLISRCDANHKTVHYSYDGFGRLQVVRDQDNNIIKTYEYGFHQ